MAVAHGYDAIVIGGGPAGSATACLLARGGLRRVLLLERERFPRFRIGESLMPASWWSLERLGVLDALGRTAFPRKHSVQFFLPDGSPTAPFYFARRDPHASSVTWQVDRAEFDEILLRHAAASGVEVRMETPVREVLFDGERAVGVAAALPEGEPRELLAPVTVDATGQSALLSHRLGLKQEDPRLRHAAIFTRYRGARRDRGIDEGATLVMHTRNRDSWFWYIPLPGDEVSVGVVGPIGYLLRERPGGAQQAFDEEVALCPALQQRIRGAAALWPARAMKDFSYISRQVAGDGWILAGDAFGFLDPIYSSGVFLALRSAEFAADAILEAHRTGGFSAAALGAWGPRYVEGMEALRRLVYAFYDREFHFTRFLEQHPDCRDPLVDLLIGNVFRRPMDRLVAALDGTGRFPGYRPLSLGASG